MSDPYEKFADLFMTTLAGQMTGLSRDQFVSVCRERYPDPADFERTIAMVTAQAQVQVDKAMSELRPGESVGVAYSLDENGGRVQGGPV